MASTTRTRTARTRKPRTVAAENPEVPNVVDSDTGETADEVEANEAEAPEVETPEAETPEAEATPKVKAAPAYRTAEGFNEAAKSLRSLSKGNPGLRSMVQLITHLAWKTPNGAVGWSKGTTADVISTADDLAIGTGTPLPQAMDTALSAAEKEVGDAQREAFDVLAGIVRGHAA